MADETTVRIALRFVRGDEVWQGTQDKEVTSPRDPSIKDSSANIEWKRTTFTLDVYHQVSPQFGFGGQLRYYDANIERVDLGTDDDGVGVEDLTAYLVWAPWEESEAHDPHEFFSAHNVSFQVGLFIPTGNELKADSPAIHFEQASSGSLEIFLGAAYNAPLFEDFRIFAGASMLIDTGNDTSGFRNGPIYDFRIGAHYRPWEFLSVYTDFDFIVRDHRNLQLRVSGTSLTVSELGSSGGTWWFWEIGAVIAPFGGFFLDLHLSVPIYHRVNGAQPGFDPVFMIGAGYHF